MKASITTEELSSSSKAAPLEKKDSWISIPEKLGKAKPTFSTIAQRGETDKGKKGKKGGKKAKGKGKAIEGKKGKKGDGEKGKRWNPWNDTWNDWDW